jgi:hypothetical protein
LTSKPLTVIEYLSTSSYNGIMRFLYRATLPILFVTICWLNACKVDPMPVATSESLNEPLPAYLRLVSPDPQAVVLLTTYQSGEHYPGNVGPDPMNARNGICTEVLPEPLLEPGDFFAERPNRGEYLPDRISAYLDGTKLNLNGEVVTVLGVHHLWDEDNGIVAQAIGPQVMCRLAEVEPGTHTASIEIQKTSGQIASYTWSFEIIETCHSRKCGTFRGAFYLDKKWRCIEFQITTQGATYACGKPQ